MQNLVLRLLPYLFTFSLIYGLMRLYYFYWAVKLVPETLEKFAFTEELFNKKGLNDNDKFKEYAPVKYKGKLWYIPPYPYKKGLVNAGFYDIEYLRGFELNAFNYINRKRYPLYLTIFNQ